MNWQLSLVCQEQQTEPLRCPLDSLQDGAARNIYQRSLDNVREFRQLEALPVKVKLPPNISAEQKAAWHKSCHLKFATSKLDKVRNSNFKRRGYDNDHSDTARKSRRLAEEKHITDACIFCNQERGDLRQVQTIDVD